MIKLRIILLILLLLTGFICCPKRYVTCGLSGSNDVRVLICVGALDGLPN